MFLLALIAPAASAAGVNQGYSDLELGSSDPVYLALLAQADDTSVPYVLSPGATVNLGTQSGYIKPCANNGTDVVFLGAYPSGSGHYVMAVSYTSPVSITQASSNSFVYSSTFGFYFNNNISGGVMPGLNSVIPVYTNASAFHQAVSDYEVSSNEAVLILAGDDYEWCTGYSLTNSGSSDIAGGWVDDKFYVATYTPSYRISNSSVSVNFSLYDTSTELYYSMVQLIGDTSDELGPQFESAEAFFASAVTILDSSSGGGSDVAGQPGTFVLPPGYVGYLHLEDPTVSITVKTTMNRWSNIGGGWYGNQTYLSGTTLPYGSRELPSSGSTLISWNKDSSGQTNLLGQTKAAIQTFTGSSNLIEIYNPYYQDAGGNSEDGNTSSATINSTIYGSTTGIMSWVMYPVEDNMSASNFSGITSDTDGSQFFVGQNDGNNNFNSFTNQDGEQEAPPEGGNNAPPQGNGINDILNNFFQRLFGLFTEGHNAIRNLTQQASEFVSHLSELYSWLPPQVLSVLTSAIILAIIIGVLKVFL